MDKLEEAILNLQHEMNKESIKAQEGLPLKLFEFCTTLLPFVNVDLLIQNSKGQILLSWRDDFHYGVGWHIPGGIIRMMETIDERIQKTAINEIGCEVVYDKEPMAVFENIIMGRRDGLENQMERAHNIALLYNCRVSDSYTIDNSGKTKLDVGYLEWFDKFPDNLLECHKHLLTDNRFQAWV